MAKKVWKPGSPVDFMWMPSGISTITASYGRGENNRPLRLTVNCDESTVHRIKQSFEQIKAENPRRPPFICIEHQAKERAGAPVGFAWGAIDFEGKQEFGVICTCDPSGLGAKNVNEKVHTSFSPTFDTDADYAKLVEKDGVWEFPAGVRGSESNPAEVTRLDTQSVGSLTNWNAFKEILPIAAREPEMVMAKEDDKDKKEDEKDEKGEHKCTCGKTPCECKGKDVEACASPGQSKASEHKTTDVKAKQPTMDEIYAKNGHAETVKAESGTMDARLHIADTEKDGGHDKHLEGTEGGSPCEVCGQVPCECAIPSGDNSGDKGVEACNCEGAPTLETVQAKRAGLDAMAEKIEAERAAKAPKLPKLETIFARREALAALKVERRPKSPYETTMENLYARQTGVAENPPRD
jgi:hypothetical protein